MKQKASFVLIHKNQSSFLIICFGLALSMLCVAQQACLAAPTVLSSSADLKTRPTPKPTFHIAYGTDPDQFAELWLPDTQGPYPLIVMLHGGCWLEDLPGVGLTAFIADDLRKNGFAVWNIEYRRIGSKGGGYPGTFTDVATAIDTLRVLPSSYHLDLSHVTAIGHSAGGLLALWAAGRGHIDPQSPLYKSDFLPITKVITLSGVDDLKQYHDEGPLACGGPHTIDALIGSAARIGQDPYKDTAPVNFLPLGVSQIIVTGGKDIIVPSQFGKAYADLAKAKGDKVEILSFPSAGHFELIDPTSDAWAEIKKKIFTN